jgi:hypothetical protein
MRLVAASNRNGAQLALGGIVRHAQTTCRSVVPAAARGSHATGPELRGDSSFDRMTARILTSCYVLACDGTTDFRSSA